MSQHDLIAKLEQATEGSRELDGDIAELFETPTPHLHPDNARRILRKRAAPYTTSLDAALSLVPEGVWWRLTRSHQGPMAEVGNKRVGQNAPFKGTPPLALCIAALRARSTK